MTIKKVIEPATTEQASTTVFHTRESTVLLLCVEHWKVTGVAICNLYYLLRMNGCINRLGKETVFSTLDASLWYWKTQIDERDRNKPVSRSHHVPYMFSGKLFGL